MADEPVVTYTVSELLKQIDGKLERLFDKLASKADQAAVDALSRQMQNHDEQIRTLMDAYQGEARERREKAEWRKWIIPVLLSLLTVVMMAFQAWHG